MIAALWREAGLPDGVFNVVHGDKVAVDAAARAPRREVGVLRRVDADRALRVRDGTAHGKRVQALGGAKNHMVVLPDADLDLAADAAIRGFGSAGERCMAISAVVAVGGSPTTSSPGSRSGSQASVGDGAGLRHGAAGDAPAPRQGGVYLDAGVPGRRPWSWTAARRSPGRRRGFWLGPTLFDHVTPEMTLYTDEIFGPVLSVVRVDTYDAALEL